MKAVAAWAVSACLAGCSYGPTAPAPTACSLAHAARQNVPNLLAQGSWASALTALDEANAACPGSRTETRADEVKLLAELGRCDDARKLADAIDADRDTTDGAWLAGAVARARCDADAASRPNVAGLADEGRRDLEAGRLPAARRHFDRAMAFAVKAGLEIRADCTHWSHKGRSVGAYQAETNAVVVVDGDHALVLSAEDGRERMFLSGHRSPVTHVAASANGRWILTASKDEVLLWSTEDAAPIFQSAGTGPLALSADGRRFAFAASDKTLALGRVGSAELERLTVPAKLVGIAVLPDRVAVSLDDDTFRVLNDGGKQASRLSHLAVRSIAPLGGGRYLLAGSPVMGDMLLRATVVGAGAARPLAEGLEEVIGVDPLGRTVLMVREVVDGTSSGSSELVLRDVASGTDLPARRGDGAVVAGQRIFSFDERDRLQVFDAATQKDRTILRSTAAPLRAIGLSPSATSMLVTFDAGRGMPAYEQLWLGSGGFTLRGSGKYLRHFSRDDRFLVGRSADEVLMFSAKTGDLWAHFHDPRIPDDGNVQVNLSQSGRFVVVQRGRGEFFRRDLDAVLPDANLPRPFVRFDGDPIVVTRDDGDEGWLDPASLRELRHGKPRESADLGSWLPDCQHSMVKTSCVDVQFTQGHDSTFTYVAGDGSRVPFEVYPHALAGFPMTASRYLAAAYKEGTILFYDSHGGPVLLRLQPFADGTGGYATTPDGRIELFGDAAKRAVCRVGALSLPFFACEERLGRTGLLASIMTTGHLPP